MSALTEEIDLNSENFLASWSKSIHDNIAVLGEDEKFKQSYRRIAAIQALRVFLINGKLSPGASAFFIEAQNDALTSHVLASCGAWRPALKILRSFIEDLYGSLYFADHPIELLLWEQAEFRLGFSSTQTYFERHPNLRSISPALTGLDALKSEYATLSKAVHGSAKHFRMTDESDAILLWSTESSKLGAWSTRHKKVIEAGCLLLVSMFASKLQGTANGTLRAVLGNAIGPTKRRQLKAELHIHIDEP